MGELAPLNIRTAEMRKATIQTAGSRKTEAAAEREAQIARMMRRIEQRLREELTGEAGTLEEIENESQRIGELVKEIVEQDRLEGKGTGFVGSRTLCRACGALKRYRGDAERRIVTLSGERRVPRAYYYCDACRQGDYPLDAALGITAGAFSIGVWALATRFSGYAPYATATRELAEVCGVHLSQSSLQRTSRQSGQQLQKDWEAGERTLRRCEEVGGDMSDPPEEVLRLRGGTAAKPMDHLQSSMDGVYLFIGGEWKEVKLAVSFRPHAPETPANYYAARLESREFGPRAWLLHQISGGHRCGRCAVIADGAPWIWKEYGKYLPRATQVLDFYHVSEYLAKVAHVRFGEKTASEKQRGRAWVLRQEEHLKHNNAGAVIRSLRQWQPTTADG